MLGMVEAERTYTGWFCFPLLIRCCNDVQPLESITPLLMAPGFNDKEPKVLQAINKVCFNSYIRRQSSR